MLVGDIALMSAKELVSPNASKAAIREMDTELRQAGLRLGLRDEAEELLRQEEEHQRKVQLRQAYYKRAFEL